MKRILIFSVCSILLMGCNSTNISKENEGVGQSFQLEKKEPEVSEESTTEKEEVAIPEDALTVSKSLINDTISVGAKELILNPTAIATMVNKEIGLPQTYLPNDLVRPNVAFSFGNQDIEKAYLRQEAATALEELFQQAIAEGITIYAVSGFRSYDRQKVIYEKEVAASGVEWANRSVAVPGYSEHQTGLAMDVSAKSANLGLTESFGETVEGKWLAENAHLYGFIIRYPEGKEEITGYRYEPWHIRYVGKEVAKDIYDNDITLEEYYGQVIAI